MGSKKLRFKKLLNEYRYLIKEQEFVQEIMKEANREFDYEYRDFCDRNELDYEELTEKKHQKTKRPKVIRLLSKVKRKRLKKNQNASRSLSILNNCTKV